MLVPIISGRRHEVSHSNDSTIAGGVWGISINSLEIAEAEEVRVLRMMWAIKVSWGGELRHRLGNLANPTIEW